MDPTPPHDITGPLAGSLLLTLLLAGLFIAPFEGNVLRPYRDIVGVLTVCKGHTGTVERRTYTQDECDALFSSDLGTAWATVERCYTGPMTEYQAAALISLAYRTGPGARGVKDGVCWLHNGQQPAIRRLANAGDWSGACAQFEQWARAGDQHPAGLARRAKAERKLCEGKV